jgi:hypothetical protein
MAGEEGEGSAVAHVRALGLRGRRMRRQGRVALRSRLQRHPLTELMPAPGDGHTHEALAARELRRSWLRSLAPFFMPGYHIGSLLGRNSTISCIFL